MGSSTKTTRAVLAFLGLGGGGSGGGGGPPIPTKTIPLQAYLDKAYKAVRDGPPPRLIPGIHPPLGSDLDIRTRIAIAIFLQSKPGHPPEYAGVYDDKEHFSASLIKVAAMLAAFKLRKAVRDLIAALVAAGTNTSKKTFFEALEPRLHLATAVPEITSVASVNKKPQYDQILSVTGFPASPTTAVSPTGLAADFSTDFADHMRLMIVPSNDCSAGECIVRLGYPYINVVLMEENFFKRASMKGVWLAGDYIDTFCSPATKAKKLAYIRIDTENDCDQTSHFCGSAQNTTAKPMAELFYRILERNLVDPPSVVHSSSDEMMDLLLGAQGPPERPGVDRSFLTRHDENSLPLWFHVDGVKIGQAGIKPDPARGAIDVRSEGIIITWTQLTNPADPATRITSPAGVKAKFEALNLTGRAAICWQNFPNGRPSGGTLVGVPVDPIAEIINTAIDNFVNQVPI